MAGLFSTFNILRRAMGAQQYALNTTSHNIANANTEGYSRQRVTMEASTPEGMPAMNNAFGPGQLGTGVDVSEISRTRDLFLDTQIRNELSTLGQFKSRDEILSEVETIMLEPSENGLSANLNKMWNAWQEVSKNPESSNAKTSLAQAAKTLTDQFNQIYGQLDKLELHSDDLLRNKVYDFNNIVKQIEDLNGQIAGIQISGRNASDLMDKQDLLIDKLAEMADIKVEREELGNVNITLRKDGSTIVGKGKLNLSVLNKPEEIQIPDGSGGTKTAYKITYYRDGDINKLVPPAGGTDTIISEEQYSDLNGAKVIFTDDSGNLIIHDGKIKTPDFNGGSIQGYESVSTELNEYKSLLNTEARAMTVAINTIYSDVKYGETGYTPFFKVGGDTPSDDENNLNAGNITVNPDLMKNPVNINAKGNANALDGNGDRSLKISQLRDLKIDFSEFTDESYDRSNNFIVDNYSDMTILNNDKGTTIDSYFHSIVGKLGSSAGQAANMTNNQEALINQLNIRKDSISGVSIDEEMANLVQYQQAYQAAAKAVTVIDELLQTVLGLIK